MQNSSEKYIKAIKIAQLYIGKDTAFREMLEHMIDDPTAGSQRNLPQRMRKMLDEMDKLIQNTVPYRW